MTRERGFTLIELMVCVTIAGLIATALGSFFLHHRSLSRALCVDAEQERTARLVLDQLRRDARAASGVAVAADGLSLITAGRSVTYRIGRSGLERRAGAEQLHYPMVARFEPRLEGRTLEVVIALDRELAAVRRRRQVKATVLLETR